MLEHKDTSAGSAPPLHANHHRRAASVLRALRHRNYRLYFGGQSISLIGTWMTSLTTNWLIWELTHSAGTLGMLAFVGQLPTFLLAAFAGVWVDRLNRHRLLILTQSLAMAQSLTLAVLTLLGAVRVWQILALQALQGIINAFDMPTRQAFLVDLIEDRNDLSNAVALNSTMVNAARLAGPSIAGLLIAWAGEGWCFLADGISYLAVIGSLLAIHVHLHEVSSAHERVSHELRDGFRYVRTFVPIRAILLLLALMGLVGMPYATLLPIIATQTLHGGAHTLGFLMGATGTGALAGALYLASRRSVLGLGRLIPLAAGIFGTSLLVLGLSRSMGLSVLVMVFLGLGFMVHMASSNTLIQTLVREDMRGRVMALYTVAFIGVAPFGSLLAGVVATRVGAPVTLMGCGVLCIVGAAVFARQLPNLREIVRPIYEERGILPAVSQGLDQATSLRQELGR